LNSTTAAMAISLEAYKSPRKLAAIHIALQPQ